MKRLWIVAVMVMLAVLVQTAVCFAGTLEVIDSYPRDGGTGLQPVNFAVKLYFNQDVSTGKEVESGGSDFKITDPEGKAQPIRVFHDSKDKDMLLVVLDGILQADTEYKMTISENFTAAGGDQMDDDWTMTFKTRDLSKDNTMSMVMMAVMFVGIVIFSSRQMKRQMQKEAAEKGREEKVNPYKVAKETGKSVSEIVEKDEKNKKKKAAVEARKAAKEAGDIKPESEEPVNDNKRVKGPRPISAAGSTYLSGKKAKAQAEAERMAAAWAAGTTKPKNQSGKSGKRKK